MTSFRRICGVIVILLSLSRIHAEGLPEISYESNRVLVCAHRANCGDAPENSLGGIKACIKAGIDMIEIDVAKTKDGKLVLMHDKTVDRTTNGKGKITDLTWEEVGKLHLYKGDGKTKVLTDETVPTLEDALTLCKGKIYVNLDLKGGVHLVKDCAQVIKKTDTETIIMYRSSNLTWLKFVAENFPHMYLSVHFDQRRMDLKGKGKDLTFLESHMKAIKVWGIDVKDWNNPVLSPNNAEALRKKKVRVWVYTMWGKYSDKKALKNPAAVWGKLIDRGINVIMTNEAEALMKYLKTIKRH